MEFFPEFRVHELCIFDGRLSRERFHAGGVDMGQHQVKLVLSGEPDSPEIGLLRADVAEELVVVFEGPFLA